MDFHLCFDKHFSGSASAFLVALELTARDVKTERRQPVLGTRRKMNSLPTAAALASEITLDAKQRIRIETCHQQPSFRPKERGILRATLHVAAETPACAAERSGQTGFGEQQLVRLGQYRRSGVPGQREFVRDAARLQQQLPAALRSLPAHKIRTDPATRDQRSPARARRHRTRVALPATHPSSPLLRCEAIDPMVLTFLSCRSRRLPTTISGR